MTEPFKTCPKCGSDEVWATDELVTGWNGQPSDEGTGRIIWICQVCGKVVE